MTATDSGAAALPDGFEPINDYGEDDAMSVSIARQTMAGDLSAFILDRIRNQQKPWEAMTEGEQNGLIWSIQDAVKHAIRQAVDIIASDGRPTVKATLSKVMGKDENIAVGAVAFARRDEDAGELMLAAPCGVLIVMASTAEYDGGEAPKATPDEPDLPLG